MSYRHVLCHKTVREPTKGLLTVLYRKGRKDFNLSKAKAKTIAVLVICHHQNGCATGSGFPGWYMGYYARLMNAIKIEAGEMNAEQFFKIKSNEEVFWMKKRLLHYAVVSVDKRFPKVDPHDPTEFYKRRRAIRFYAEKMSEKSRKKVYKKFVELKEKYFERKKKRISGIVDKYAYRLEAIEERLGDLVDYHARGRAWKKHRKKFEVYNTETRPLFQGRKTAQELRKAKIKVTTFVDAAARVALTREQETKKVDLVFFARNHSSEPL